MVTGVIFCGGVVIDFFCFFLPPFVFFFAFSLICTVLNANACVCLRRTGFSATAVGNFRKWFKNDFRGHFEFSRLSGVLGGKHANNPKSFKYKL